MWHSFLQLQPYFVAYDVLGNPTAAALINDQSRLCGGAVLAPGDNPLYLAAPELVRLLHSLGSRPRVYANALTDMLVERVYGLPAPTYYHDEATAIAVLGGMHELPNPAAQDAIQTVQSLQGSLPQLMSDHQALGLSSAYAVELGAVPPTVAMTHAGLQFDFNGLQTAVQDADHELQQVSDQISEALGRRINLQDSAAVRHLVYDEWGCGRQLPPDHSANIKRETLQLLAAVGAHSMIDLVRQGREAIVTINALSEIRDSITPAHPYVHSQFDPRGTSTGRFTSTNPCLHSLPWRFRHLVVARPGHLLVDLDFRHADLRVITHFSQDPRFLESLRDPRRDAHAETGSLLLKTHPSRDAGKLFNLADLYGRQPRSIAAELGCTLDEATEYQRQFHAVHVQHRATIDAIRLGSGSWAVRRTLLGRRVCDDCDPVAAVVQGSQAELLKLRLAQLHSFFGSAITLRLSLHDSILLEIEHRRLDELLPHIIDRFQSPVSGFRVPIYARARIGLNWGHMGDWPNP